MKIKGAWALQSLFVCFLFNAALAIVIFLMADKILEGLNEWVSPFIRQGAPALPEDVRSALNAFGIFLAQLRLYLVPALAALISAVTLLLWFVVFLFGCRQIGRAGKQAVASQEQLSKTVPDGKPLEEITG
ncbi:MAG: hypothetical protein AB9866_28855 [Syntrophobacteraceae bacterium]